MSGYRRTLLATDLSAVSRGAAGRALSPARALHEESLPHPDAQARAEAEG